MRYRLRTLLTPRQIGRFQFTYYELLGLLTAAACSLGLGTAFEDFGQKDKLAVAGVIAAFVFNGIACYLIGAGIGRRSGKQLIRQHA